MLRSPFLYFLVSNAELDLHFKFFVIINSPHCELLLLSNNVHHQHYFAPPNKPGNPLNRRETYFATSTTFLSIKIVCYTKPAEIWLVNFLLSTSTSLHRCLVCVTLYTLEKKRQAIEAKKKESKFMCSMVEMPSSFFSNVFFKPTLPQPQPACYFHSSRDDDKSKRNLHAYTMTNVAVFSSFYLFYLCTQHSCLCGVRKMGKINFEPSEVFKRFQV